MKKVFLVFICCLLCFSLFVVPSFALSNPTVFSPDHLNSDPKIFVFSSVDDVNSLYVPESTWLPYLVNGDLGQRELALYVMCLDDHFNLIDRSSISISFSVSFYKPDVLSFTRSYQFDDCHILLSDLYSSTTCNLQFQVSDSRVSYVCLIPLGSGADESYNDSISDWDYRFNSTVGLPAGYSVGYDDGFAAGELSGRAISAQISYDRGYNDGYSDGYSSVDMTDQFHQISDATLLVVSAPFQAINNALNFNVFGVNIASLFAIIVTLLIIGFIIKKFI